MAKKRYLGFYLLTLFSCTRILVQSILLESDSEPQIGQEFTLTCNTSSVGINWYRNNIYIGWSENQYTIVKSDACNISTDPERYTFEHCGVKHELTIKSLNDLDDGSVWRCQNRQDSHFSNNFTLTVFTGQPRLFMNGQQLVCLYKAEQNSDMKFLPWKHSIDNELVREIEGYYISDTVYGLNMTNSQNNGGIYSCSVNDGGTVQKVVYNFIPQQAPHLYEPTLKGELQTGDNSTFTVTYLENNILNRFVNVSWYRAGQILETVDRVTIGEEPSTISHPYNNNIKLPGIKTILTIKSVIVTDQEFYSSQICNQNGCSLASFQLAIADDVNGEDSDINVTEAVIVAVLAVALLIVGIFVFIKCRKYRASKQSESCEQNVYDSTVPTPTPTPASVYDTLGTTENENGSSEYDRAIHVPSPASEYTTLGQQSQYENTANQPPSVYYNTLSGVSMTEKLKEETDNSNEYENPKGHKETGK
ncbi:hypothetical protein LOTGIDRAFT_229901 [Lottia gigantea]|uniref:Ig-like domain-containing protein n=1 Tax=Lottia gigantea TaxID=225164 RepID=V4BFV0_LOTGI|nr:hypothetical protein LOTGIDRAFT_229901 [Lottia gigantea]ESP04782.1 hypothetical protein LOTGIDRAFT_229901 [Lottia gigantea]